MPKPIEVRLEWYECEMASFVGYRRQCGSLRSPNANGRDDSPGWNDHIMGAGGELAVAKLSGQYWDGSQNRFHNSKEPDVGRMHVRTRPNHTWDLIIRPDDPDDGMFVLVTGHMPRYLIHGWYWAGEAKKNEWWDTKGGRPGCWWVPQREMKPLKAQLNDPGGIA